MATVFTSSVLKVKALRYHFNISGNEATDTVPLRLLSLWLTLTVIARVGCVKRINFSLCIYWYYGRKKTL